MLTTVRLYGILGKKYGRIWRLDVQTPQQAVHAINVLRPGFLRTIYDLRDVVLGYRVRVGGRYVHRDSVFQEMALRHGGKTITITPVFKGGGGNQGIWQIIGGAALIVVGALLWETGPIGAQLVLLGAAMALGGVASLLAPQQNMQGGQPTKHKSSYQFGGPVNTIEQGQPFPVCYGDMICGTAVLSAGITNEDILKGATNSGSLPSGTPGGPSNTGSGQAGIPFASDYGTQQGLQP
jgi:predicted phage tail protein